LPGRRSESSRWPAARKRSWGSCVVPLARTTSLPARLVLAQTRVPRPLGSRGPKTTQALLPPEALP